MTTKCIVLGQENEPKKELKKIEFKYFLRDDATVRNSFLNPVAFKNIELISKQDKFDIMFAYDFNRDEGCLYLGFWNDGIV